jgi:hypothetical protein
MHAPGAYSERIQSAKKKSKLTCPTRMYISEQHDDKHSSGGYPERMHKQQKRHRYSYTTTPTEVLPSEAIYKESNGKCNESFEEALRESADMPVIA